MQHLLMVRSWRDSLECGATLDQLLASKPGARHEYTRLFPRQGLLAKARLKAASTSWQSSCLKHSSSLFGSFPHLYRPVVEATHLSLLPSLIHRPSDYTKAASLDSAGLTSVGDQWGSLGLLCARIQATPHSSRQR